MRAEFETITFSVSDGIARLTLNRPERLNGITNQMMRDLYEVLAELPTMSDARVVVLTGAGRGFCPGADLGHYSSGARDEPLSPEHFMVTAMLHELPQVSVAAVNGACAGAGLGWAAACDLRYAARSANFNSAFLGVGISGDMASPVAVAADRRSGTGTRAVPDAGKVQRRRGRAAWIGIESVRRRQLRGGGRSHRRPSFWRRPRWPSEQ